MIITIWPDSKGIETHKDTHLSSHIVQELQYDPILRGLKLQSIVLTNATDVLQYDPILRGLKPVIISPTSVAQNVLQYDPILRGLKPVSSP